MNDFDYDALQKKRLAKNAAHRVNGAKSKKCTLPSDNLTDAQKRKLNGPVETYAINRPMSWDAFKRMPVDLQQAHIDYIQNRFEVGVATIEKYEFIVGVSALRTHCLSRGIRFQRFQGKKDFGAFIAWARNEGIPPVIESTPGPEPIPEPEPEIVSPPNRGEKGRWRMYIEHYAQRLSAHARERERGASGAVGSSAR